ncbi:PAS domain S-box protein [Tumebacillus flagellatus]|uniref:histidine kinase n=1 Tax=Tumebacillus flagellatus TaxID=1157490 RepID=A0A074LP59_9BACL|nr:PAS domain S-box protein [Tumebacillus flagellatus]KEO81593.1 hypothetical protein EL26_20120 [Tumebacillus flagellatus]
MYDAKRTQPMKYDLDFYRSLFENHPDAVMAWADGRYTLVNAAAEALTGYTEAELREEVSFCDLIEESEIPRAAICMEKALAGEAQQFEIKVVRRDKRRLDVHVTKVPMVIDGQVRGVFNIVRDITERKRAEEELCQSEFRLARAQRLAKFGSWEWDMVTDSLCCSEEMHRILGAKLGEINSYGKFISFVVEEDRAQVHATAQAAIEGITVENQFRVRRPDGEIRVLHAQAQVQFDENGNPLVMYGTDRDITEQLEQERRIREHDERLRIISENAQDIITYSSPEGIVLYVSPSTRTLLGYEPDEIIGKHADTYYHPEDKLRMANNEFELAEDGMIFSCRILHKEGRWIWFETSVKRIRDEHGAVVKLLGIGRDITLRKRAEEHLRATRDQLDSFIENNVDAIGLLDREGKLLRTNPAYERMFGLKLREILGSDFRTIPAIPENLRGEMQMLLEKVRHGEAVLGHETYRFHRDGTKLNVLLSLSPVRDVEGRVDGFSVTIRDITERKRTEELLLQSEKLGIAGQLAAGIAHEIRNPLTALKGFVQLMQVGNNDPKYLDVMSSELKRIESIVSELLVLAKPQAALHKPVRLQAVLAHVLTLIETQAILNNVEILAAWDADTLPTLTCDENQMKQVFLNFLQNAIDAMPNGGRVTLDVERPTPRSVRISIADEGVGIAPDLMQKLGEPFYTTKEKGTGLGLMVSKRILEQHQGRLQIDSILNEGTTVQVLLPCLDDEQS